jgi:hypothetical protein
VAAKALPLFLNACNFKALSQEKGHREMAFFMAVF